MANGGKTAVLLELDTALLEDVVGLDKDLSVTMTRALRRYARLPMSVAERDAFVATAQESFDLHGIVGDEFLPH